ncbi:MAG: carbohydrate kinase family protein [Roseitalea sp.]|jgi:ribokinase|nr:carbohydrate kinase family protein [Roseitalea sp.]MBO6723315.1 carbohydrate kinase family protein [Roseitalea sp.]MBO6741747.1 carbohydrate kinase family protein [Roseitalea sp.]
MARLAVTGYASLDYPVVLDGMVKADRTTHIRFRDPAAWPRAGGSPTYVAGAAAIAGIASAPVAWVGDDALGAHYVDHCRAAGLDVSGLERHAGARSPAAIMIHQADGSTACLYDPGPGGEERLTAEQARLIAEADMACLTVGPGHLVEPILAARPADRPLCWVMKDDPTCFGPESRAALAARAGIIFCNAAERPLIGAVPAHTMIVETLGADGVRLHAENAVTALATEPVAVADPTGAGDSFAGAFIAAHLQGAGPEAAARTAMEMVAAMLRARARRGQTMTDRGRGQ